MRTIKLTDHLAAVAARKAALGMVETPESVAGMRNRGERRTPAKRAMLREIAARAAAAGKTALPEG